MIGSTVRLFCELHGQKEKEAEEQGSPEESLLGEREGGDKLRGLPGNKPLVNTVDNQ